MDVLQLLLWIGDGLYDNWLQRGYRSLCLFVDAADAEFECGVKVVGFPFRVGSLRQQDVVRFEVIRGSGIRCGLISERDCAFRSQRCHGGMQFPVSVEPVHVHQGPFRVKELGYTL
jgi:hypothetical protein